MNNNNNNNNAQNANNAGKCVSDSARDYIPSTTSKTNQSKVNPDKRERRDGPGGN